MQMKGYASIVLAALLTLGASNCTRGVRLDTAMAAVDAGDFTAIVEGCGHQPVVGYTYCRKQEGEATNDKITFIAPPSSCLGSEPCSSLKVFYPDGSPTLGLDFPKKTGRLAIGWSDLTKKPTFDSGDRGFWPFVTTVRYLGEDGKERTSVAEGEIRLRVYRNGYLPLNEVREDQAYAWKWASGGFIYRMTTGARAYAGVL